MHVIFVAIKVPTVKMESSGRKFEVITFQAPIEQLQHVAPALYNRCMEAGKKHIKVLVAHADQSGNIWGAGMQAIEDFKPDAIFTCYPAESRRAHPSLPIVGWHDAASYIHWSFDDVVVMLESE